MKNVLKQNGKAYVVHEQTIDNSRSSTRVTREIKYQYKERSELEVTYSTTMTKLWKGFAYVDSNSKTYFISIE